MSALLEARKLSYSMARRRLLDGIDFALPRGSRTLLLGANGSGKTTLLRLLNGLIAAECGEILFDGQRLDRALLGDRERRFDFRRRTALLFQNPEAMFFHETVRREICYGPERFGYTPERTAATLAELSERLELDSLLDRFPGDLSEGEKKRVALALVLAHEPELLLLDEPLAGLDPPHIDQLLELLAEREITLLVSTHQLDSARRLGDCVVALRTATAGGGAISIAADEFLGSAELLRAAGLGR